jgi:hypothetical protein
MTIPVIEALGAAGRAYLDPGTGSQLLQILLAAGMSVLFLFGLFRKKLAELFRRVFRREAEPSAPDDD